MSYKKLYDIKCIVLALKLYKNLFDINCIILALKLYRGGI